MIDVISARLRLMRYSVTVRGAIASRCSRSISQLTARPGEVAVGPGLDRAVAEEQRVAGNDDSRRRLTVVFVQLGGDQRNLSLPLNGAFVASDLANRLAGVGRPREDRHCWRFIVFPLGRYRLSGGGSFADDYPRIGLVIGWLPRSSTSSKPPWPDCSFFESETWLKPISKS